ncbi:sensor histidine kinase [Colwellia hornerae]|uniref:histidine kinase n=1 Tax=Colwellia hornerae TaxID=89402 RepID=A0A5C6Q8V4_9GAMM|nr:HAMP domain-containing sensor histidine kinase [Colwellia hornerae]TWX57748.1 HAMP domain-containing histidine kinase [Colwellia hornerae]TWX62521.1 HAMP domain-containing histidine kinase [Colwellia hornerae]TWX65080.1 HAMP domain-containing histidine kinase [Colwellia hornerae]
MSNDKKQPQTLRRYVLKVQSMIALIIVLSYTLVINFYFIHGLDEANFQDLHLESNDFARQYQINNHHPLPNTIHFQGFLGWKNLPTNVQEHFADFENVNKMTMDNMRIFTDDTFISWPEQAIFIIAQPLFDGKTFYLVRSINIKQYDALSQMGISKMFQLTWPIALVFLIIMHFSVQLLLMRTLKPFYQIGDWVESLTLENVNEQTPNFEFYELTVIANQQKKALLRLGAILDKEQDFLRHASHELRTPIAVVKSNSELLTRILSSENNKDKGDQSLARISRAALNMQHTTETLLWLSQEQSTAQGSQQTLALAELDLNLMIDNLVEDNAYLLQSKQVKVTLELTPTYIKVFETPCRLVLNNLIRNAFQYTAAGEVIIQCSQCMVIVENINISEGELDHSGADYGYGLGLRLVDKIVNKMHWSYQNNQRCGGRKAIIDFRQSV